MERRTRARVCKVGKIQFIIQMLSVLLANRATRIQRAALYAQMSGARVAAIQAPPNAIQTMLIKICILYDVYTQTHTRTEHDTHTHTYQRQSGRVHWRRKSCVHVHRLAAAGASAWSGCKYNTEHYNMLHTKSRMHSRVCSNIV